jgi:DNA-binding MarR family transcriptional regulator
MNIFAPPKKKQMAKEEPTGFVLWQVASIWERELKKSLEGAGLSYVQYMLMASCEALTDGYEPVTQTRLSETALTDPMTTSKVLRVLEGRKLLRRREHPSDTRAKAVELTEKGRKALGDAAKSVEQFDKKFFASVSTKTAVMGSTLRQVMKNREAGKKK